MSRNYSYWTKEEQDKLYSLAKTTKHPDWEKVVKYLPGRTILQCKSFYATKNMINKRNSSSNSVSDSDTQPSQMWSFIEKYRLLVYVDFYSDDDEFV